MRKWKATFYRSTDRPLDGPVPEELVFAASNKTQALKTARLEAKNRDWRFLPDTLIECNQVNHYSVPVPDESIHFMNCRVCGASLDMRDLGQVFTHEHDLRLPVADMTKCVSKGKRIK